MTLEEWLAQDGRQYTAANLCRKAKLAPPLISKILHKRAKPSLITALIIDKATDGAIKAETLCPKHADLLAHVRGVTA